MEHGEIIRFNVSGLQHADGTFVLGIDSRWKYYLSNPIGTGG